MKKNILNKLLLVLLLPVLFSCRTKKMVVQAVNPAQPQTESVSATATTISPAPASVPATSTAPAFSKTEVFSSINSKQTVFSTLSVRAKADLNIDNKNNDVTMNIRIEKDKAIWISLTALIGLEVARVLITPDSIKIRDNINGEYTKKPFSYIYGFTNRQINFNTLQSLFVGNPAPEVLTERSTVTMNDKSPALSGSLGELIYAVVFNDNYRIIRTDLKDARAKQMLTITYGDFTSVSGQTVPQSVNIKSVAADKNIGVNLSYSRLELNVPVEMPFSVPSRFKVKE
jgi:hypothetical protein